MIVILIIVWKYYNMSNLVLDALQYYRDKGYNLIDVPYIVPEDISLMTKPDWCEDTYHSKENNTVYVGSGEQSFLHLIRTKRIKTGKYACLTPCVRDEQTDDTHYKVFLKLELIHVLPIGTSIHQSLDDCIKDAKQFFNNYIGMLHEVKTEEGYDIYYNDLELGSYGHRQAFGFDYIYGTGLALPRFNIAHKDFNDYLDVISNLNPDDLPDFGEMYNDYNNFDN